MALTTALRVVGRSEPIFLRFDFFEDESVVVVRPERHDVVLVQRVERRPLRIEAVRLVVEAGGRFFRHCRRRGRERLGVDGTAVVREPEAPERVARLALADDRRADDRPEHGRSTNRRDDGQH
jgi:hypothetical protein